MKAGDDRARRRGSSTVVDPSRGGADVVAAVGRIGRDNAVPDDGRVDTPQTQLTSSLERGHTTTHDHRSGTKMR
jgi:hypothetical protein